MTKKTALYMALMSSGLLSIGVEPTHAQSIFDTLEYRSQEGLALIQADKAYQLGYTGQGVTVGVVDSGINALHPEFNGGIAGGYHFSLNTPINPGGGNDEAGEPDDDGYGHGSHVAGIIAARKDGAGMHGVAYDAQIYMVGTPEEDLSEAFNFAAQRQLKILNLSLGLNNCDPDDDPDDHTPYCNVSEYTPGIAMVEHESIVQSFHELTRAGTLSVFATGNESQPHPDFLGGAPHLFSELKDNWLAVTSVGLDGQLSSFSNRCGVAQEWCLAAPGGEYEYFGGTGINSVDANGGYIRFPGTSMAAPHVAGAAALVAQAFPYFNAYHLQQTILTTATDMGNPQDYGWGLLNVGKAVRGPAQFTRIFDVDTRGLSSTFSNDISGAGTLIKRGAGTLELTGYNTYPLSTVTGGKLVINGTNTQSVHVDKLGTLGGTGTIGVLSSDGTVAPGNSIGTLNISNDFTSNPGSRLLIEVDGQGNSDSIKVGGTARIDGAVLELDGGPLRTSLNYSILNAGAGIQGQFDPDVILQSVFLAPHLNTTFNSLTLSLQRNGNAFESHTQSTNQAAVARALDARSAAPSSGMMPLYDTLLNSDGTGFTGIMDQLSGEIHSSVQSTLMESDLQFGASLNKQIRQNLRSANSGANGSGPAALSRYTPVWAQISGSKSRLDGNDNTADINYDRAGIMIGAEGTFGQDWHVGAALGFHEGKTRLEARNSSARTQSYSAALYTATRWPARQGHWQWLAGLGYSQHDIDSKRHVTVSGAQTLNADYRAHTTQFFTELAYDIPVNRALSVEPHLGLTWLHQRTNGFNESGGITALTATRQSTDTSALSLGLRASALIEAGQTPIQLNAGLAWRHTLGNTTPERRLSFADAPNLPFTVAGAPIARNVAQLDLSAQRQVGKLSSIGLTYSGQFGGGSRQNAGSLFLQTRF